MKSYLERKLSFLINRTNAKVKRLMYDVFIPSKKKCYITVRGKTDGMGAQVHAIYSGMLYAKIHNKRYLHSQLNFVQHNNNDKQFARKIENYFSINCKKNDKDKLDKLLIVDVNSTIQNLSYLFKSHFLRPNKYVIFSSEEFHDFGDRFPQKYELLKKEIVKKYYTNSKNYVSLKKTGIINIAIHLRRGDVGQKNNKNRFTSNDDIKQKLFGLISLLNKYGLAFEMHIFSQGVENDFEELKEISILHLNMDVFETFNNLVEADILFTAKSSFSYCAALLSEGIIIYEPFWHSPLKEWFTFNDVLIMNESFITAIKSSMKY